jgi:hypothetical protein
VINNQTSIIAGKLDQQLSQMAVIAQRLQDQVTALNADRTPPSVEAFWPNGATATRNSSATLQVIASDNGGGPLQVRVNGGPWQAYSPSVTVPLTTGLNTVVVEVRDAAGNVASARAQIWRIP